MDALRIGRSLRALRIRRGWRQVDVAVAASVSRSQYARIERGELRGVPIADLVDACSALGADLDVRLRWHGEGLDRLLDATHARLVERVVRMLDDLGWETAVEVSFNRYGERGAIDILGWHATARALLVVEAKSVVPDAQAMLSAHDRKARLAEIIGRSRGWDAVHVGRLLVIADSSTSRRRVLALPGTFGAAYRDRAIAVRGWLRRPQGALFGLLFLPDSQGTGTRRRSTARERVQGPRRPATGPG
jgi:transcriptional regulator with XRE-family HTH domain